MKTLKEFKKEHPSWEIYGPANKIIYALYFEDKNNNGLTEKRLQDLTGLTDQDFTRGIERLRETEEVSFKEDPRPGVYFLEEKTRNTLNSFYD